jgi:hypothetical protein
MIDLTPLLDDSTAEATLVIEPLTPVAMNSSVPSKHMRTATVPPVRQVKGMFENALGLQFGVTELRQDVGEQLGVKISRQSTRRFQTLLEAVEIEPHEHDDPDSFTFDDDQWLHKWRPSSKTRKSASVVDYRFADPDNNHHAFGKTVARREHLVTTVSWRFTVRAPSSFLDVLRDALEDPAAPLYIGTSDGWIDATLM